MADLFLRSPAKVNATDLWLHPAGAAGGTPASPPGGGGGRLMKIRKPRRPPCVNAEAGMCLSLMAEVQARAVGDLDEDLILLLLAAT